IGRWRSVAEVAAEARAALDRDAADNRCRRSERRVKALHRFVAVDAVAGQRRADGEAARRVEAELLRLGNLLYIDEEIDGATALAGLDEDVRTAGEDARCLTARLEQRNRLLNRRSAGVTDVLHTSAPLNLAKS